MAPINLKLIVDSADGISRGYPDSVTLTGSDRTLEQWQPAEASMEMRTLRSSTMLHGPRPHGRARGLVEERMQLLFSGSSPAVEIAALLNDVAAGRSRGYLEAERVGQTDVWRSPIYAGSLQLHGDSYRFENKERYHLRLVREPYFELAGAATSLTAVDLRSRESAVLTAPSKGSLPAPLELEVEASSDTPGALRVYLWQDRHAPGSWTEAYSMAAAATSTVDDTLRMTFSTARPQGKDLGYPLLYSPVLVPTAAARSLQVRNGRGEDGLTVSYGASSAALAGESEVGVLGRLAGFDSVFSGMGPLRVDEMTDYYHLTAYASEISGTDWQLWNMPSDGFRAFEFSSVFSGAKAVAAASDVEVFGDALYLGPGEGCVIVALIETVGSAGAEYGGALLSLQASIRPRISEIV